MTEERRPSIAIVDDDSGFAGYLRTFLGVRGYEARSYTRGDEIVAAIRQGEPPDIVLLDVAMRRSSSRPSASAPPTTW
jgi:DNA-binding response OmpR family regulator